uniref:RNase H type-1 domain-containing protein n=1 Tax=Rhizophagus irregularis (strain DAOM 181602 / DAOM 197198 / MUCL 43194) TaxID=747089 RepID=U9TH20_RHIID
MNEWDYWKHEYEPRTDIDECIYESLMEQIELSEFEEILASTNNWRAPGISGITYDFMKHNRNVMKGKLVDLMNSLIGNKIEDKEEENQVLLDGCSVKINNSEEGARFLGVWFSAQANFKSHNRIIEDCVKRLTNVMRWKKLTAKECIYLWNTVIIPVVEYQLQCTVLNKVLIEKLDSKIRSVIKQKCGLAAHTSNSVIHDKDFLGCKSVEALQKESKQIWLLERLKVLAEDNFKLCNHNRLHGHVVSGGHMSIDEMIDKNILSCSVKSLSLVNIMYITQLIDENNRLKTWRQVTAEAGRSSKGKIPNWFKELENKLMKNDQREVFACYELISEVYDLYNNNVILRDSWEKFNEIYIGREYDDLIEFDNRFKLIEKCFVGGQGFRLLEKEYLDLVDVNQSDLKIYTDGSKKEYVNGIGWVIFNGDKILSKGRLKIKGNYEVWELELVAIVAALMIVNKDSKIVKDLWDKLVEVKNGIWSTRRIWNVKFSGIWKWIKGHSGDLGNEMADSLSKLALRETEGSLITYLNIPEDMS